MEFRRDFLLKGTTSESETPGSTLNLFVCSFCFFFCFVFCFCLFDCFCNAINLLASIRYHDSASRSHNCQSEEADFFYRFLAKFKIPLPHFTFFNPKITKHFSKSSTQVKRMLLKKSKNLSLFFNYGLK